MSTDYNQDWTEYFKVDKNSPSGLLRIKNRVGKSIEGYCVGSRIFRKNGDAVFWQLNFKNVNYVVHRIIWVLENGSIDPELVIDHLDGNPLNNLVSNLSLKTMMDNSRNQRLRRNNTTGVTGVNLTNKGEHSWYYSAYWQDINGSQNCKHFSIKKFGEENAKALAVACREQQIKLLILEGANYTERHGKSDVSIVE